MHRYAAHGHFTMSKGWEKTFYLLSWLSQGVTALSPNTYGKFHKMHHAFADTEKDVHSPKYSKNLFTMMLETDTLFRNIKEGKTKVEARFSENVPNWKFMEKHAYTFKAKGFWMVIYALVYYVVVPSDALWMWAFLPLHFLMCPIQGVLINWFAHKVGYRSHEVSDTSTNLIPFDLVTLGEGYHNNHHADMGNVNFAKKWYEFDFCYTVIKVFNFAGIIRLVKQKTPSSYT